MVPFDHSFGCARTTWEHPLQYDLARGLPSCVAWTTWQIATSSKNMCTTMDCISIFSGESSTIGMILICICMLIKVIWTAGINLHMHFYCLPTVCTKTVTTCYHIIQWVFCIGHRLGIGHNLNVVHVHLCATVTCNPDFNSLVHIW